GGLTGLQDKRVGLIGTGATAVQVVPQLGKWAKELYVFQRTPSSIDARGNRPTDDEWAKSLKPGWQAERVENFNRLMSGLPVEEDMVADGWTENFTNLYLGAGAKKFADLDLPPDVLAEVVDLDLMKKNRERIASIVNDPGTAEKLMPYFRHFCKRPCYHDDYLPIFNRPNVHLVDTEGRGVETFSDRGIVVGDQEYELDCVIFATGFDTNVRASRYTNVGGFSIYGRDGLSLADKWASGGRSLHGLHVHGFPNLIILSPIQSAYAFNWQRIADGQSEQVAYLITEAKRRGLRAFEATQAAEDDWVASIISKSGVQVEFLQACTPGYFNGDGKLPETAVIDGAYAGGNIDYFELLAEWRKEGSLAGLNLGPAD
ncbi:MAG: monooxygenase, partial [Novosphingobium sp.]